MYGLVGLVPDVAVFWKFLLTLVLFNLTTASVVLLISVAFSSIGLAGLVGTLIMLYKSVDLIIYVITTLTYSQPLVHRPFDQSRLSRSSAELASYHLVLPCRV